MIHPVNMRVAAMGAYDGCERCARAYESVMASNLTFTQIIVAGDSWGVVSVRIIEESPLTIIIFMGVLVTINFGVLNLILTVIVKVADDAKSNDLVAKQQVKERELKKHMENLTKVCETLDDDQSGCLTYEEIVD